MSVNSGLKATKIIGQRKAFYRQRISEFSCTRKETGDTPLKYLGMVTEKSCNLSK